MIYRILILTYLFFIIMSCKKQVPFDSEKWKALGGEWIMTEKRLLMTENLLNHQLLLNKTQVEIDSMLGPRSRLTRVKKDSRCYMVQEVYSWDIDPIELIFLEISFNESNKSSSVDLNRQ